MKQDTVDFTYLYEIADNDSTYIHDVIEIFLNTIPEGLVKLEKLIVDMDDWDAIYKQAHFLKSSVSIVKVKNMFDNLNKIELLARQKEGKDKIIDTIARIRDTFDKALPIIIQEKDNPHPSNMQ